jgi:hypothetical protein
MPCRSSTLLNKGNNVHGSGTRSMKSEYKPRKRLVYWELPKSRQVLAMRLSAEDLLSRENPTWFCNHQATVDAIRRFHSLTWSGDSMSDMGIYQ